MPSLPLLASCGMVALLLSGASHLHPGTDAATATSKTVLQLHGKCAGLAPLVGLSGSDCHVEKVIRYSGTPSGEAGI